MTRQAPFRILLASLVVVFLVSAISAHAAPVTFRFDSTAGSVYLAGEFNGWSDSAQTMEKNSDGIWEVTIDLDPGAYQYKFVADGTWVEDPAAAEYADDGFGGKNSIVQVGDGGAAVGAAAGVAATPAAPSGTRMVRFATVAAGASQVFVAGEFNGWNPSGDAMADEDGDGIFEAFLPLAPGRYQYKFVIDGEWTPDPTASESSDDGFGGENSIIEVTAGSEVMLTGPGEAGALPSTTGAAAGVAAGAVAGAAVAVDAPPAPEGQRNVLFRVEAGGAVQVYLAGEFNAWNPSGDLMSDEDGDGVFQIVMPLAPGSYMYKFVIDGNWTPDPNAADSADDGFGGQNSLVHVSAGDGVQEATTGAAAAGAAGAAAAGAAAGSGEAIYGSFSVDFRYQPVISGVSQVMLAGTFNDWNAGATPMLDPDGDGIYEVTLLLAAGEYQYKFVVDGTWLTDESADAFADDGFGGQNSVLQVDARFEKMDLAVGDGEIYLKGLELVLDYGTLNAVDEEFLQFKARAYRDDVQRVKLHYQVDAEEPVELLMDEGEKDPVFVTHRAMVARPSAEAELRFVFEYEDGEASRFAAAGGQFADELPSSSEWILYTEEILPPFSIPMWAQTGVYYQIFPERFGNADQDNDQDFADSYYDGRRDLPAAGTTNGEYFHFIEDWDDISGLTRSPYRSDGKPDYYSFYGGDIAGIHEKIPYLAELGVTIIYFNPITDARSNHRYDPCDYNSLDPHLANEDEFKAFTAACLEAGIRVIVDMAFNHTGDCHFAFQDVIANWKDSEYYDWYEWKKQPPSYPLPPGANAIDYYDCWWGFGLHPNLNFDLTRPNAQENGIRKVEDADPNWEVVNYILKVPGYWMGELGVSGFRLDVPNEVPFWFWGLFREECRKVKEDHLLVGEIWGDAGEWINPEVFDVVMNYRYFKDPVVKWIGQKKGNAATFDQEIAPGRSRYPLQAVRAQMNLVDSHDTQRFLRVAGEDPRRLRLAATFAMTYMGAPHIYYGDELAMTGGKDPDCRRTMPWSSVETPARKDNLQHYQAVAKLRHENQALSLGDFETVHAKGHVYAYLRRHAGEQILIVLNNDENDVSAVIPVGNAGIADGTSFELLYGEAPSAEVFRGALKLNVPAVDGVILKLK